MTEGRKELLLRLKSGADLSSDQGMTCEPACGGGRNVDCGGGGEMVMVRWWW